MRYLHNKNKRIWIRVYFIVPTVYACISKPNFRYINLISVRKNLQKSPPQINVCAENTCFRHFPTQTHENMIRLGVGVNSTIFGSFFRSKWEHFYLVLYYMTEHNPKKFFDFVHFWQVASIFCTSKFCENHTLHKISLY